MAKLDDLPRTSIAGIELLVCTRNELAQAMVHAAANTDRGRPPDLIGYANGQVVAHYGRMDKVKQSIDGLDATTADGMPLVKLSRWFGRHRLPERVAMTDFFHDAAKAAAQNGIPFYFLGADEAANAACVNNVQQQYPELMIAGRHHGYFGLDDEEGIVDAIHQSGAKVLWVAMGVPLGEAFMVRNREALSGIGMVISCGGLFNFLAGKHSRAPEWMRNASLEWLYRLALEPKRLGIRYLTTNIEFFYRVAINAFKQRQRG